MNTNDIELAAAVDNVVSQLYRHINEHERRCSDQQAEIKRLKANQPRAQLQEPWHWPSTEVSTPMDALVYVRDDECQRWYKNHFAEHGYAWTDGKCSCKTRVRIHWNIIVRADPANPDQPPPKDLVVGKGK